MLRLGLSLVVVVVVALSLVPPPRPVVPPRRSVRLSATTRGDLKARVAAFRVLEADAKEATTAALLERHAAALAPGDARFCRALVRATQRNREAIDARIDAACKRRPNSATLTALRLGLAQLLFLDAVPARAAVHTSVEVARAFRGSTGLVNAVLRGVDATELIPRPKPPLHEGVAADFGVDVADRFVDVDAPNRLDVTCKSSTVRDAFLAAVTSRDVKAFVAARGHTGAAVRTSRPRDAGVSFEKTSFPMTKATNADYFVGALLPMSNDGLLSPEE